MPTSRQSCRATSSSLKYEDDAASAENEARWPWIARAVNALGLGYRVLTERHVIDSLRAETALAVFERRMTRLPELTRIRAIVDAVTERGACPPATWSPPSRTAST
ncbi:hypothetical protein ACRAWG_19000 [Methylobacterium sp. P31]